MKVTEVPAQIVPTGDAAMVTLTGLSGFTVMVIAFEVAGLPVAHVAFEVTTQVTTSALLSVLLVKTGLFDPTDVALTYHAYTGETPPLVTDAVKVTPVPAQMVVAEAEMDTLTGRSGFTVIFTTLDVAGFPVAQATSEVSMHVTASPSVRVLLVNTLLLIPSATPLTYHS